MKREVPVSILIIGEDSHFGYLMRSYVRRSAHKILYSYPEKSVLEILQHEQPAAIILDVDLHAMGGWNLLRTLKSNPDTCKIPVVICSWSDEKERGILEGASVYFKDADPIRRLSRSAQYDRFKNKHESSMIMIKNWIKYILAYGLWMVFTLVGILFLMVSRNSLIGLLEIYYVRGNFQRGMEVQFLDKAYLLVVAFAILIIMIVVEEYFKHGAQRGDLAKRIFKVFGFEILFMFFASLASGILVGFNSLIWLLLVGEFVASIAMIYFGIKLPAAKKKIKSIS